MRKSMLVGLISSTVLFGSGVVLADNGVGIGLPKVTASTTLADNGVGIGLPKVTTSTTLADNGVGIGLPKINA